MLSAAKFAWPILTINTLWANSADKKLMIIVFLIFFFFFKKTGFDISRKFSPFWR